MSATAAKLSTAALPLASSKLAPAPRVMVLASRVLAPMAMPLLSFKPATTVASNTKRVLPEPLW